jgi:Mor family transcriptional regulator
VTDDNLSQDMPVTGSRYVNPSDPLDGRTYGAHNLIAGRVDRSYLAERNKAIIEAYQRGASYEQLAQHYGLLRASVRQLIQGSYGRTKQAAEP